MILYVMKQFLCVVKAKEPREFASSMDTLKRIQF